MIRLQNTHRTTTMRLLGVVTNLSLLLIINSVLVYGDLKSIANSMKVGYTVIRNGIPIQTGPATSIVTYLANITIENTGSTPIEPEGWSLHLCHDRLIHPMYYNMSMKQYAGGGLIVDNFLIKHTIGCMFNFTPYSGPDTRFKAQSIQPGATKTISVVSREFLASRYAMYPNWYLANSTHTNLVPNTMDNDLKFVGPFEHAEQYTRYSGDVDGLPLSPIDKYRGYRFDSKEQTQDAVLPTPFKKTDMRGTVTIDSTWFIDFNNKEELKLIAEYLQGSIAEDTGIKLKTGNFAHGTPKVVQILVSAKPPNSTVNDESYTLQVNAGSRRIVINGYSTAAVINGIHTLRSLLNNGGTLKHMVINDFPRLNYRGLELDVSSNFFGLPTLKKVIDIMASYKLNKLVLILGANEGWRLEIPEIPELTQIGGKRCEDISETNCLYSQLGSSPDGSDGGFFTQVDYKTLVKYAGVRGIEIIPHFNMASKARAAIKSMTVHSSLSGDTSMMLQDPTDNFAYMTPHLYSDSAVNPCLPNNSTLRFFEFLIRKVKTYHSDAGYRLKHIHIGGENSPELAWTNSTHCQRLLPFVKEELFLELKVNYSMALGLIADKEGVQLIALDDFYIAWPTNLRRIVPLMHVFSRDRFPPASPSFDVIGVTKIYDQLPQAHRSIVLADEGYKVIMQPEEFFSFDTASEPEPDVPGEYTADTRYINATKVFNFLPDKECCNHLLSDEGSFGCTESQDCPGLTKRENIIGIQASIRTRHIRDENILFKLLLPRLMVYAERAWHKSAWENSYNVHRIQFTRNGPFLNVTKPDLISRDKDWIRVASIIGNKELPRLVNTFKVIPSLPPPGARKVRNNETATEYLQVDVPYPGLVAQKRTPGSSKWIDVFNDTDINNVQYSRMDMRTRLNQPGIVLTSNVVEMPLTYLSLRQEIRHNITENRRRQMVLEQQRRIAHARQMELLRQRQATPARGWGFPPNQFMNPNLAQNPGQQQTGMQRPGLQQPGMQQPGLQQAGLQRPGLQQQGLQRAGLQQPGLQRPGIQQPPGLHQAGLQLTAQQRQALQTSQTGRNTGR